MGCGTSTVAVDQGSDCGTVDPGLPKAQANPTLVAVNEPASVPQSKPRQPSITRTRKNSVEAELDAMNDEINLVDDVESFLVSLQLEEYCESFEAAGFVELKDLLALTTSQLGGLGWIKSGHIKKLSKHIDRYISSRSRLTAVGAPADAPASAPLATTQPRCRRASAEQEMEAIADNEDALDLLARISTGESDVEDDYDPASTTHAARSSPVGSGSYRTKEQAAAAAAAVASPKSDGDAKTRSERRGSRGSRSSSESLPSRRVRASYSELPELPDNSIPVSLPAAAIGVLKDQEVRAPRLSSEEPPPVHQSISAAG